MQKKNGELGIPIWLGILIPIVILVMPIIVAVFMHLPIFGSSKGSVDGWLSYWGGYLGAFLGLTAVVITTSFMIGEQRKNHLEQMKVQIESINKAAELNDKKERERIYASFLVRQNEEIIKNIININQLNTKRFNTIRHISDVWKLKEDLIEKIKNDNPDTTTKERMVSKGRVYNDMLSELKSNETDFRGELLENLAMVRIKSEYFPHIFQKAQDYKKYHEKTLDVYHEHIKNEDITPEDMLIKIENETELNMKKTNEIMGLYTAELLKNMKSFNK